MKSLPAVANPLSATKWLMALAVFASFLLVTAENRDPDLGWHLKTGEWILEHRAIQRFDEWSYTMPGYEWVDHEWLFNAWIYWMKTAGLWPVAIIVLTILAFLPVLWWIRRAVSFPELLFIGVIALGLLSYIGMRPQLISFAFFALLSEFLLANPLLPELSRRQTYQSSPSTGSGNIYETGYNFWYLFGIPLFFFLWANLHGGFPAGLALLFLFIAGDAVRRARSHDSAVMAAAYHALVLGISFAATLINPHGINLYREIWGVASSSLTAKFIIEWLPAFALTSLAMPVMIALPLIFFLKYLRRYENYEILSFAAFFTLYMKSSRNIFFYAVAALPIVRKGFVWLKEEILRAEARQPATPKVARASSILKALIVGALVVYWTYTLYNFSNSAQEGNYPESAVVFLKTEISTGAPITLLNNYGWGGYIIANAPEIKVFIDGRMPHWKNAEGNSAMEEYAKLFYSADDKAKREILARRKINAVLTDAEKNQPEDGWIGWLTARIPKELRKRIGQSKGLKTFNKILTFPESLIYGETTDLKELLFKDGWEIAYKDETAAVFRCPEYNCSLLRAPGP